MLLDYLPSFIKKIEEFKKIMEINDLEILNINEGIDDILKNLFIFDASEDAINRYENILEIIPKSTHNLEKRKDNILFKYRQTLPFTVCNLIFMLNSICGENGYVLDIIYESFILKIKIKLENKGLKDIIDELLERVVPMNLIINVYIDYNTWNMIRPFKWDDIKIYKWQNLKDDEIFNEG